MTQQGQGDVVGENTAAAQQGWRTIDSAPLNVPVLMWAPTWRQPFVGTKLSASDHQVWIDTCELEAKGRFEVATHWIALPAPPKAHKQMMSAPGSVPTSLAGQGPAGYVLVPKEIVDRFPEINVNNYDYDDVCALNAWGCEVVLSVPEPPQSTAGGDAPTFADYEEVFADHNRLVRKLDVLLNGEEGAAPQASLCDIVGQVFDKGLISKDALSAERARVIEECAKVIENWPTWDLWRSEGAAALRALGQQDTGQSGERS